MFETSTHSYSTSSVFAGQSIILCILYWAVHNTMHFVLGSPSYYAFCIGQSMHFVLGSPKYYAFCIGQSIILCILYCVEGNL